MTVGLHGMSSNSTYHAGTRSRRTVEVRFIPHKSSDSYSWKLTIQALGICCSVTSDRWGFEEHFVAFLSFVQRSGLVTHHKDAQKVYVHGSDGVLPHISPDHSQQQSTCSPPPPFPQNSHLPRPKTPTWFSFPDLQRSQGSLLLQA